VVFPFSDCRLQERDSITKGRCIDHGSFNTVGVEHFGG